MKPGTTARLLTASLMLGLFGGAAAGAQDEGGGDSELGVGLYLGNCESLVAGAALYDLGDAEQETEEFANADENAAAGGEEAPDLESELEGESSGDETDVEGAVEGEEGNTGDTSDEEVVVQDANFLVWVNAGETFGASLVDLVDAPFAIAVRQNAQDDTEGEGEDGDDFLACGTFGGAVAGDELVLPLRALNDSGFTGISVLGQGEGEGESVSSLYLFRDAAEDELAGEDEGTPETDGDAAGAEADEAEETEETEEAAGTDAAEADEGTPQSEEGAADEETPESEPEETPEAEKTPEPEETTGGTFITPTPTS